MVVWAQGGQMNSSFAAKNQHQWLPWLERAPVVVVVPVCPMYMYK
jgi:hypothetical protein